MSGSTLDAPLVPPDRAGSIGSDTDTVIRIDGSGLTPASSPAPVRIGQDKPSSFHANRLISGSVGIASTIVSSASTAVQSAASKVVTTFIGKKKRNHFNDFAIDYDYCIIFPAVNKDGKVAFKDNAGEVLLRLNLHGFETFCYTSAKGDNILVLIKCTEVKLKVFADEHNYKMLMNADVLGQLTQVGLPDKGIAPINIFDRPSIAPYRPLQHIYGRYSQTIDQSLYFTESSKGGLPFSELDRLKLVGTIIESRPGCEPIKFERLTKRGTIVGNFFLHEPVQRAELVAKWLRRDMLPWTQPFDDIREYFGEKYALYFLFYGHYSQWLLLPALIGFPCQIAVWVMGDYSAPFLPYYAYFIALWGVVMLEYWKRKEKTKAMEWGTIDFEDNELDRAEFKGRGAKSHINGEEFRYFPRAERNRLTLVSYALISLLLLAVIGTVTGLYLLKDKLPGANGQIVVSLLNSFQIQFYNYVYNLVAIELSNCENHRTETEHEESVIGKVFVFQFVNSYASFFYLGFFAQIFHPEQCNYGDAHDGNCMAPLAINLAIVLATRLVSGFISDLIIPYIIYRYKMRAEVSRAKTAGAVALTRPEREFLLEPIGRHKVNLVDFVDLALQFGYNTLFASALPISSLIILVSHFIDIRGKAWKLLHLYQRPRPSPAEDIGAWQTIFTLLNIAAVIVNAALSVFSMYTFNNLDTQARYWIFIGFQWSCFSLQALLMAAIPDVPESVEIQLTRTAFLVDKFVDLVPDDVKETDLTIENSNELQSYPYSRDSIDSTASGDEAAAATRSSVTSAVANPLLINK